VSSPGNLRRSDGSRSPRRASLPGADELFRATSDDAGPDPIDLRISAEPADAPNHGLSVVDPSTSGGVVRAPAGKTSGRQRHDEKITVYVSADELVDLERARLALRADHGIAVDRGRIVREALAYVLADLENRGDASLLVRRLRRR
jgi:hypothetical protein